MNKVAQYLQQHVSGEILVSPDVLRYFSTDESILQISPQLVVYPRNENDIRKTARFTWQLAEKGRVVPITVEEWEQIRRVLHWAAELFLQSPLI